MSLSGEFSPKNLVASFWGCTRIEHLTQPIFYKQGNLLNLQGNDALKRSRNGCPAVQSNPAETKLCNGELVEGGRYEGEAGGWAGRAGGRHRGQDLGW